MKRRGGKITNFFQPRPRQDREDSENSCDDPGVVAVEMTEKRADVSHAFSGTKPGLVAEVTTDSTRIPTSTQPTSSPSLSPSQRSQRDPHGIHGEGEARASAHVETAEETERLLGAGARAGSSDSVRGPPSSALAAEVMKTRHVPAQSFKFPKTDGRPCLHSWFEKYGWLHYVEERDHVLCFTCVQAQRLGRASTGRGNEDPFTKGGFKKWKKAVQKFDVHQNSKYHRESCDYVVQTLQRESVGALLSAQFKKSQEDARTAYRIVLSSIRYLARSGQAMRGAEPEGGNLLELLQERALDCPKLAEWLNRRDKWISADIQNEVLEILAHKVMRTLVNDINASPYFSVMADGTTDISGDEQLSTCVRYVETQTLEIFEVFLGLCSITNGSAQSVKNTIFDVLLRLGLKIEKLRGHCFDGAAAMAGRLNGAQKLIADAQPKSIFVHCSNHALDLVFQELVKQCDLIFDALALVKDVSKSILESAKRKEIYKNVVIEPCSIDGSSNKLESTSNLRTVCPTRWCVRCSAVRRFLENYARVQETLQIMLDDSSVKLTDERRAILRGYAGKMEQFSTVLALKIFLLVCEPAEQLAKALQGTNFTATGAKHAAEGLLATYKTLGEDDFDRLWTETEKFSSDYNLDLTHPTPSRVRAPPKRLGQIGGKASPAQLTERQRLRKSFVEVLDWAKSELKRRFDQPGMEALIKLEQILIEKHSDLSTPELVLKLGVHASDFNVDMLLAQLKIADIVMPSDIQNVKQYADAFRALPATSRLMLDQVNLLIILLMTIPATSASCERSFSALKRLKTYLRSTMTQKRLTHLMILHVHKKSTFEIKLEDVLNEFSSRTAERRNVFGVGQS